MPGISACAEALVAAAWEIAVGVGEEVEAVAVDRSAPDVVVEVVTAGTKCMLS